MKKILIFITFALFIQLDYAQAQKKDWDIDLKNNRFELGTDLLWLKSKNSIPSYTLQFKIHQRNKNKHQGAWRFKIGSDFNLLDTIITNYQGNLNTDKKHLLFDVGYQKNYQNDKFILYHGADLHTSIERIFYIGDYYDFMQNIPAMHIIDEKQHTLGTKVFIGMNYFLTPHISFSIESNILLSYTYYTRYEKDITTTTDKMKSYNLIFRPVSLLNFNIHF